MKRSDDDNVLAVLAGGEKAEIMDLTVAEHKASQGAKATSSGSLWADTHSSGSNFCKSRKDHKAKGHPFHPEGKTPDSVSRRGDRLGVVIVDFDCWKNVNQCL